MSHPTLAFRKIFFTVCLMRCLSSFSQYPEPHYPFPEDSVTPGLKSVTVFIKNSTGSQNETVSSFFEYDRNGRITVKNHRSDIKRLVYDTTGRLIEEWMKLRDSEYLGRCLKYEGANLSSDSYYYRNPPHSLFKRFNYTYKENRLVKDEWLQFSSDNSVTPNFSSERIFEYSPEGKCIRDFTTNGREEWLYENGQRSCRISYFETGGKEKSVSARYNYFKGHFTDYYEIDRNHNVVYYGQFEYNSDMHYTHSCQWSERNGLHEQFYTYNDENRVTEERIFHRDKLVSRKAFYYDDQGRFSEMRCYDENGICTSVKTLVYTYYED